MGNFFVNSATSPRIFARVVASSLARSARSMKSATTFMSASFNPRVVTAGVPRRTPLVTFGGRRSVWIAVLLQIIPAARTAERLVRRRSDDVGMWERRCMRPTGDEPGDMGDVREEQRAHFVRDLFELGEVDGARIGAVAAEDHLRLQFLRFRTDGIE